MVQNKPPFAPSLGPFILHLGFAVKVCAQEAGHTRRVVFWAARWWCAARAVLGMPAVMTRQVA